MNEQELLKQIQDFFKKYTKEKIELNTSLKDLGMDSLDLIDLILDAEKKFGIEIPDDKLMEIKVIKDLIVIIISLKK